jgi:hypothetical protein
MLTTTLLDGINLACLLLQPLKTTVIATGLVSKDNARKHGEISCWREEDHSSQSFSGGGQQEK